MDETQCLDDYTELIPSQPALRSPVLARLKARLNENLTAEFELREGVLNSSAATFAVKFFNQNGY